MTKNAYIHIPFCKSKCNYCSFVSFADLGLKEQYLDSLISQIRTEYKGEKLNTLYFGGGTPSLLTVKEFKSLIDLFTFEDNAEITVEVNPDSTDFQHLQGLKRLGINRLSIGSQTFDDKLLSLIGRRHNAEAIKTTVEYAQKAGLDNISLDFIYGIPTQTLADFEKDLKKAVELGVQHISLYGLKIEEGCYFYKHQPEDIPNLDIQADMYLKAVEVLKSSGFEHYEISNFSKINPSDVMLNSFQHHISERPCDPETHSLLLSCADRLTRFAFWALRFALSSSGRRRKNGFNSRHNLNYWDNNTYYGFGCSASGYIDKVRYQNESDLIKYIKTPLSKGSKQELSEQEILEEAIFLGFRKTAGINTEEINNKFGIDFNEKYAKILDKYSNFFIKTSLGWALTLEGILISNEILSEFIIN